MRIVSWVLVLAAWAPAVLAQPAEPRRGPLLELAQVLGESHALRQACAGPDDQFWRSRMMRLIEVERPDALLEKRLKAAFNEGFEARAHGTCTLAARRAEASAAARGRTLSARLAGVVAPAADAR